MSDVLPSYSLSDLKSLEETLPVEIGDLEQKLNDTQTALARKRKLQSEVKDELVVRATADAQSKTRERIAGKPVKTRLRMLAALMRSYIRERHGEFYGDNLNMSVTYNYDSITISFGSWGGTAARVSQDGALCYLRKVADAAPCNKQNAAPINVLNDHPRTWKL